MIGQLLSIKRLSMKTFIIILLTVTSLISFIAIAKQSKDELAQEIADCYVAHERAQTHMYTSGRAEKMKVLINKLVGNDIAKQKIQTANDMRTQQKDRPLEYVIIGSIQKYCSKLDQRLAKYKKSQVLSQ